MVMLTDKQQKEQFKPVTSKNPDKYFATAVLKEQGFVRKKCKCGTYFWSVNKTQTTCGDPACSGGFRFYKSNPCKKKMSYVEVWLEFAKMFKKLGYTPIKRYPVVARWNPTMEYTNASIAAFQPFVVSGEVEPPANPLVIPQFCMRFVDTDNVGITGSHHTGFVMIGQHMFVKPKDWDQNEVFRHIKGWVNKGLGLPDKEITFHEDAWAGGGNFGCCMEFFSRGVELGNQVYMLYEQTPEGPKELNLKVLDMGMGMERNAWFSQGTPTIYDAVFPAVLKKLYSATGYKADASFMKKFTPHAGELNLDEVDDIDKAWRSVAKKVDMTPKALKEKIQPMAGIYSIAEHMRSLLVTLNDGALPSNVGGGYNLRMLIRRSLGFIDKYGWKIYLPDVCKWHANELKPVFPELRKNLDDVSRILDVEINKYENTKQKSHSIVESIVKKKQTIDTDKLIELYDSQGIAPDIIQQAAAKEKIKVNVPDNFYKLVSERHEKVEQIHATRRKAEADFEEVPETEVLYYDDYKVTKFRSKIVSVVGKNIVLDKTYFYPTSGGQMHDTGTIDKKPVVDVFKQGSVIVHVMDKDHKFKVGQSVDCAIDQDRRFQLAKHHTATHIVNAAARRILGPHINQAGAKKTEEKAHLDITHFQGVTQEELDAIETESNRIVSESIKMESCFMARNDAEKKYGMSIYQGGAVPGKQLRMVNIPEVDVECCAGTHLHNTGEVGQIKILGATKIQDGVVRITFVAGDAAKKADKEESGILKELSKLMKVKENQLPARAEELFTKWKKARKAAKKKKKIDVKEFDLVSDESYDGDIIEKVAEVFSTQPEHIVKTAQRFLKELDDLKKQIKKL
ncbi:alanine--tRNA ligase [Candidatus Woesearchaeota archaeon]|nr:alanine--tRNA ligase [Candidatus Woesearchaeota archaeon]